MSKDQVREALEALVEMSVGEATPDRLDRIHWAAWHALSALAAAPEVERVRPTKEERGHTSACWATWDSLAVDYLGCTCKPPTRMPATGLPYSDGETPPACATCGMWHGKAACRSAPEPAAPSGEALCQCGHPRYGDACLHASHAAPVPSPAPTESDRVVLQALVRAGEDAARRLASTAPTPEAAQAPTPHVCSTCNGELGPRLCPECRAAYFDAAREARAERDATLAAKAAELAKVRSIAATLETDRDSYIEACKQKNATIHDISARLEEAGRSLAQEKYEHAATLRQRDAAEARAKEAEVKLERFLAPLKDLKDGDGVAAVYYMTRRAEELATRAAAAEQRIGEARALIHDSPTSEVLMRLDRILAPAGESGAKP